jgi:PAS domain S-box-containing protein
MAEHAPVMIWQAGPDRKCVYVNRAWLEFTGRALDAEAGFGWTERVHPEDRDELLAAYVEAFESRRPFEAQFRLCRRDGAYRRLLNRGVPLLQGERLIGFVGSCADQTERVLADERTAEVLALVSHELRSPLNAIKGWSHVLENQLRDADSATLRALNGIRIGIEHQVRLIDDLLVGHSPNPEGGAMAQTDSHDDRKQAIERQRKRRGEH